MKNSIGTISAPRIRLITFVFQKLASLESSKKLWKMKFRLFNKSNHLKPKDFEGVKRRRSFHSFEEIFFVLNFKTWKNCNKISKEKFRKNSFFQDFLFENRMQRGIWMNSGLLVSWHGHFFALTVDKVSS